MNYASQDTVYAWQQPIAPLALLSEESTRQQLHSDPQPIHSSSHSQNASGSSLDQRHFQPLPVSGGSAYPHYTYCTVQAALIPVQGGYQYNPAQGMLPIQGAASCRSTPFVSHGTGKECVGLANTSCHRAVGVCHSHCPLNRVTDSHCPLNRVTDSKGSGSLSHDSKGSGSLSHDSKGSGSLKVAC